MVRISNHAFMRLRQRVFQGKILRMKDIRDHLEVVMEEGKENSAATKPDCKALYYSGFNYIFSTSNRNSLVTVYKERSTC